MKHLLTPFIVLMVVGLLASSILIPVTQLSKDSNQFSLSITFNNPKVKSATESILEAAPTEGSAKVSTTQAPKSTQRSKAKSTSIPKATREKPANPESIFSLRLFLIAPLVSD